MTQPQLLEQLTHIANSLGLPFEVGLFTQTPAPATYLVATPLTDSFDVYADNTPGVEVEEARLSLFTTSNYLPVRDRLTRALTAAGLTITGRHYVGYEADTGYHHYVIDTTTHHPYQP